MVGKVKRWLKKWLGIEHLDIYNTATDRHERENLRLAKAVLALETRLDAITNTVNGAYAANIDDFEVRIAYLENSLTAKTSTAKIVPKAHKPNWKQFRSAAEKASEPEQETA